MQMGKKKYNLVGTKVSVRVWLAHAPERWRDKLIVEGIRSEDSLVHPWWFCISRMPFSLD